MTGKSEASPFVTGVAGDLHVALLLPVQALSTRLRAGRHCRRGPQGFCLVRGLGVRAECAPAARTDPSVRPQLGLAAGVTGDSSCWLCFSASVASLCAQAPCSRHAWRSRGEGGPPVRVQGLLSARAHGLLDLPLLLGAFVGLFSHLCLMWESGKCQKCALLELDL